MRRVGCAPSTPHPISHPPHLSPHLVAHEMVIACSPEHHSEGTWLGVGDTTLCSSPAAPVRGGGPQGGPLPAVSMEAASCPFFFAVTYLPLAAFRVMRLSHHSMSK